MSSKSERNRRILTLAAEVAEALDRDVPILLLSLNDLINDAPTASREISQWKRDIWDYDLLEVLILVLKQNFDYINGKWSTAARLARILSACCVGVEPTESREFYGVCLPNAAENLLILSRKLQAKVIEEGVDTFKKELLNHYYTTLEAVSALLSAHSFLATNVMRSSWTLQLLITDDIKTGLAIIKLLQSSLQANADVLSLLDEKVVHSLLDELIFKLTVSEDVSIGSAVTRLLCLACTVYRPLVRLIGARYRGLRPLLNKWTGKGFGQDLKTLLTLLDAGDARRLEAEQFSSAAIVIQAHWRSYCTRRQLERASHAVSSLQKIFRNRKIKETREKEEKKQQSNLQHQLLVARKRAMRETRQKQLQILSILPASEIAKHLANEREQAALCVQTAWRGYAVRKELASKKQHIRRIRAAVAVQRQFRKYLARRQAAKLDDVPFWKNLHSLTDERRVQLQNVIAERRELHPPKTRSRQEQEDLHAHGQEALRRRFARVHASHRCQQHQEALLAELETDAELLLTAPKLADVTADDIELFVTRSVPVAAKARYDHNEEMRLMRQPWWKKLGDRYQDEKYAEEQGAL